MGNKVIEQFLNDRPELSEKRKIMLRYLGEVADKCDIEARPKGRSIIKCYFDCGAYKGDEVLSFRINSLSPLSIAVSLASLTSGHHFSFPDAENVLLSGFIKRFEGNLLNKEAS